MSTAYDVIVVGYGNADLCSDISAIENGDNVLILEKTPNNIRGGNSFFTDGAILFAYGDINRLRKAIPKITDETADSINMPLYSDQDYYNDIMEVTGNESDPKLA